jgi:cytochrome c peroxidase
MRVRVAHAFVAVATIAALAGCGGRALDGLTCDEPTCTFSGGAWARIAALSPLPPPPADPSNKYQGNPDAIALGHAFFVDPSFAGPATDVNAVGRAAVPARAAAGAATGVSCATCHDVGSGGADVSSVPGNVSAGAGWTDVNALSIVNTAYNRLWLRNGRADSGWAVSVGVAEGATTMNGNRLQTAWAIADRYRAAYEALFGPLPMAGTSASPDPRFPLQGKPGKTAGCQAGSSDEPFGDAFDCMAAADQKAITGVLVNWAKAIDAYEAAIVTGDTPFDRFVREGASSDAISASAKRGARLFVGKASCVDCHAGPLLSDGLFHNIGVEQTGPEVPTVEDCPAGSACDCTTRVNCLPAGAWDGQRKLVQSKFLRSSIWSDAPGDPSRASTQSAASLEGAWRTPSLRNVALTGPYMHDGLYATLADVVAHYNRGGDESDVGVKVPQLRPLGLTDGEQADLVAFLGTLTGDVQAPSAMVTPGAPPTTGPQPAVVSIATSGSHTCAELADGTVRCWGADYEGQLGDGQSKGGGSRVPVAVKGLGNVVSVAAGGNRTCAVVLPPNAGASVSCWGDTFGALPVPVIAAPASIPSIAAGTDHACAVLSDQNVWCWGAGPMPNMTPQTFSPMPAAIPGTSGAMSVSGVRHNCAAMADGTARCFGDNEAGQLGDGTVSPSTTAFAVVGLSNVVSIAAGYSHTCAALADGTVRCWGDDSKDQLGNGLPQSSLPTPVTGLSGVVSVAAGYYHTCALLGDGTVSCWGQSLSRTPTRVPGLTGVASIAAGAGVTCAVTKSGQAWCWGANFAGQLGDGTTTDSATPVLVKF